MQPAFRWIANKRSVSSSSWLCPLARIFRLLLHGFDGRKHVFQRNVSLDIVGGRDDQAAIASKFQHLNAYKSFPFP